MEKKIIDGNTLIMDAVEMNPNAPEILLSYGMHCLGCAIAHGETISEAAEVHVLYAVVFSDVEGYLARCALLLGVGLCKSVGDIAVSVPPVVSVLDSRGQECLVTSVEGEAVKGCHNKTVGIHF